MVSAGNALRRRSTAPGGSGLRTSRAECLCPHGTAGRGGRGRQRGPFPPTPGEASAPQHKGAEERPAFRGRAPGSHRRAAARGTGRARTRGDSSARTAALEPARCLVRRRPPDSRPRRRAHGEVGPEGVRRAQSATRAAAWSRGSGSSGKVRVYVCVCGCVWLVAQGSSAHASVATLGVDVADSVPHEERSPWPEAWCQNIAAATLDPGEQQQVAMIEPPRPWPRIDEHEMLVKHCVTFSVTWPATSPSSAMCAAKSSWTCIRCRCTPPPWPMREG